MGKVPTPSLLFGYLHSGFSIAADLPAIRTLPVPAVPDTRPYYTTGIKPAQSPAQFQSCLVKVSTWNFNIRMCFCGNQLHTLHTLQSVLGRFGALSPTLTLVRGNAYKR